jgi:DNA-binding response OmpR family regulator
MKLLVIEDDERIAEAIAEDLAEQHYAIDLAHDGQVGLEMLQVFVYDLVLLDLMLPKIDGVSLCQQLRAQGQSMPVLMLTARDTITDKVMGLDAGADDYVVKPCALEELSARIRALLRRGSTSAPPILEWEQLQLIPNTCEVFYQDKPLSLTPKEYSLLELFLRNQKRVFSRPQILEHLWSFNILPAEDTVKAHIKGVRQKLKAVNAPPDLIETVYGIGYRLKQNS